MRKTIPIIVAIISLFVVSMLSSCRNVSESEREAQLIKIGFQQALDTLFQQNQDAVGAIIHVEFPDKNISWTSAVGHADKAKTNVLDADQPLLIASNTKTYVAASILRLVEMQSLELNNTLETSLTTKTAQLFTAAGYDLKNITIKHLLSHTSGIHDYVDDDYFEFIDKNQQHQWKKQDQIALTLKKGKPAVEAGKQFGYGDINYLLLTEIIEKVTEQRFYNAVKTLLKLNELGLKNTWFKDLEPVPKNSKQMAHQYASIYDWDSYQVNPSWDLYGGGGLATTAKEAALFYQYLFEGKIIEDKILLKSMHTYVLPPDESKYCLGLYHFISTTDIFYHGGWWGTDVGYSPEANATVSMFTLEKGKRSIFGKFSKELLESLVDLPSDAKQN